jgi:putative FmdB family regulatory protein
MPTYEYKREDGTTFEITQGMNDPKLTTCPTTGLPVTRIISGGGGVLYKGTGWYVTDYKDSDKKTKSAAEKKKDEPAPSDKESKKKNTNGTASE